MQVFSNISSKSYAGTQRVSSKIGTTENLGDFLYDWFTQGTGGPIDVIGSSFGVLENAEQGVVQVYDELGIEAPEYDSSPVFIPVQSFVHGGNELEQYFFHPDHLGSTSYITNLLGEVSQHMEYFAFGETFVEEHRSSNNSPYKFNGKELDEETGLYYYGARYYDPRISIWLSVDPLVSDGTFLTGRHNGGFYNSFNQNSYIYCYQNPVILIDPNGKQTTNKSLNSTLKNLSESNPNDDIYLLNNVGIPSGNVVTARNQHHWKDKTYQMTKIYSGKPGGGSQFAVYNNNEITSGYAGNLPASSYQSASYDISFEKINGNGSDQLTQESLDNLSKVASSIKKSGQTIEINSIVNLTRNGQAIELHGVEALNATGTMNGVFGEHNIEQFGLRRQDVIINYLLGEGVSSSQLIQGGRDGIIYTSNPGEISSTILNIMVSPEGVSNNNIQKMSDYDSSKGDYIQIENGLK